MTTQDPLRDKVRRIVMGELGGLTPQEWARLFAASRTGLITRMADEGLGRDRAEQLVDEWDAEAEREGLPRHSTAYWDLAPEWIRERARRE